MIALVLAWGLLACAPEANPGIPDPAETLLAELDRDGSGGVEAAEVPWMAQQGLLGQSDADKSGALDREELRAAMEGTFAKPPKMRPAKGTAKAPAAAGRPVPAGSRPVGAPPAGGGPAGGGAPGGPPGGGAASGGAGGGAAPR